MRRPIIKNDLTEDIEIYFNNFVSCNIINKNINELLCEEDVIEKEKRLYELFENNKITENEYNIILKTIMNKGYLLNIPQCEYNWIKKIITFAENIPICITISTARKEHFGFPLIYVNKHFEKVTEYNRDEIIGKSCKILRPNVPILEEESRHALIRDSLLNSIPLSVIVTNIKKSGVEFYNLLSFKPVFNKERKYIYCIGIQTEITMEPINKKNIRNIEDVLIALTNFQYSV
jgi:PAS domain S-box-containing protein